MAYKRKSKTKAQSRKRDGTKRSVNKAFGTHGMSVGNEVKPWRIVEFFSDSAMGQTFSEHLGALEAIHHMGTHGTGRNLQLRRIGA